MTRVVAITDCDHDTVDPERAVLDGHDVELRRLRPPLDRQPAGGPLMTPRPIPAAGSWAP
jgi:hypothetical protein